MWGYKPTSFPSLHVYSINLLSFVYLTHAINSSPLSSQHVGSSILHIWNTVRLRILVCFSAVSGDPGALFPEKTGTGQWRSDGGQQSLLHGSSSAAEESGGTAGSLQNLPDPQPLHAGPDAAGPRLPSAHAQRDVSDAGHGDGGWSCVRLGVDEQVAKGPGENEEVL